MPWVWPPVSGGGGPATPTGPAGGDLTGTYPDPDIANGVIPTSLPPSGPAGGDLDGTYPDPTIAAGVIPTELPPSGPAGGDLDGTYPDPTIAAGVIPTTLPPSGDAGGDLDSTYPDPTVVALTFTNGRKTLGTQPTAGQALFYDEGSGTIKGTNIPAVELAPAAETPTGFTWNGAIVYAQRFTGTMPTTATGTLVSGVDKIVRMMGYVTGASGKLSLISGASNSFLKVDGSNNLTINNSGTDYDGNPYDIVAWYTKV